MTHSIRATGERTASDDEVRRVRRRSPRRRDEILNTVLAVASSGGYEAVQMRRIADQVGIAVGTLYRYFPSKTHLLVSALTREFLRLEALYDWPSIVGDPSHRLTKLTTRLHAEWQRDPLLTEAMTRAFVVADASAAAEVDRATQVINGLLAGALSGGEPTSHHVEIAGLLSDIWLANLTAFISDRVTADEARLNIDRAGRLLLAAKRPPRDS